MSPTEPDDSDEHGAPTHRLGGWFIILGWIAGIALLAWLFEGWYDRQFNPNSEPRVRTIDGGRVEVVLDANRHGHYVATGRINGKEAVFLLDTGATGVAVPESLVERYGLLRGAQVRLQTANGEAIGYMTRLDSVSIGGLTQHDVSGVIATGMSGEEVLLGMSFLRHLNIEQAGGRLTLRN